MKPSDGAMGTHHIRPALFWFWVAGAAAVAAVVWFALSLLLGFQSLSRQVKGFQRAPIPGQAVVSFAEPGGYTLYFEGSGASEQGTVPAFDVSLTSISSGQEISIRDYGTSATYGLPDHSGRALGTFRIEEPGRYLLRAEAEPRGVQANVAAGPSVGPTIVRAVLLAIVGALILVICGAVLALVVALRRRRGRSLLSAPAAQAVSGQATAPPGWFADPGGRHEFRYWDGQRWTEHVSDRGTRGVDPMSA